MATDMIHFCLRFFSEVLGYKTKKNESIENNERHSNRMNQWQKHPIFPEHLLNEKKTDNQTNG